MSEIKLTDQEKQEIERKRKREAEKTAALQDIEKILKEGSFRLVVNPQSPIGNPSIIIVDNE